MVTANKNSLLSKLLSITLSLVVIVSGFSLFGTQSAHAADTTNFTGTVIWDGGGTHNSATELEGKLLLYRDFTRGGKAISDMVQSDEYSISWSEDSFTIANLPSADDEGNEYTYWISQDSIEFYETTYSVQTHTHSSGKVAGIEANGTIKNTYRPNYSSNEFMTVTVTKTWDDNDNAANKRPESLQIYLVRDNDYSYRAGTMTGDTTAETWTYTFTDVPVYSDPVEKIEYSYSVREIAVDGYAAKNGGKANQSNGTFSFTSRRDNYTYVADGAAGSPSDTSTLPGIISPSGSTKSNLSQYYPSATVKILPEKMNFKGVAGTDYILQTDDPRWSVKNDFTRYYGGSYVPSLVYTFDYAMGSSIWMGKSGNNNPAPKNVTVVFKNAAVTKNGYADVKCIYDIEFYDTAYRSGFSGTTKAFSITTGDAIFFRVLSGNGSTTSFGYMGRVTVSVIEDGIPVEGSVLIGIQNMDQGDYVSGDNIYTPATSSYYGSQVAFVNGAKSAAYITSDSFLKNSNGIKKDKTDAGSDGTASGYRFLATTSQTQQGYKSGFAALADAGGFTLSYRTSYVSGDPSAYTIINLFANTDINVAKAELTNKLVPTSNVTIAKIWEDNDDEAGMRPESITLHLYKDKYVSGSTEPIAEEVASKTIKKSNNWPDMTISDLPVEDAEGNRINYYVIEESIPGYETRYDSGSGYVKVDEQGHKFKLTEGQDTTVNVQNMIVGETNKVTVKKEWQDDNDEGNKRPGRVTIRLYEYVYNSTSGKYEGPFPVEGKDPLVLTPSNNWAGEWTGLQAMKGGRTVFFNVEEDQVANYRPPTITRDQLNGFVVINSRDLDTKTYKVVFNDNASNFNNVTITEHAPSDQNVTAGANAVAPSPSPKGEDEDGNKKVVSGWYKETACENEFNFNTEAINNNTTLYAKWSDDKNGNGIPDEDETKYSVTYKYADGSPTTAPAVPAKLEDQLPGMEITVAADPADIDDYIFGGWKVTTPASGTSIDEGKFTMPEGNVEITGAWMEDKNNNNTPDEDDKFTVIYKNLGETIKIESNLSIGDDTPAAPNATEVTNPGHTFKAWHPERQDKVRAEDANDGTCIIEYNATWDGDENGDGIADNSQTFTVKYTDGVHDEVVFEDKTTAGLSVGDNTPAFDQTNPDAEPSRTDYVFSGWNPEVKEKVAAADADTSAVITYTATWKVDKNNNGKADENDVFTVIYYDEDGATELAIEENKKVGDTLAGHTPVDDNTDNRVFSGWNPAFRNVVAAEDDTDKDCIIKYTAIWKDDLNNDGEADETEEKHKVTYVYQNAPTGAEDVPAEKEHLKNTEVSVAANPTAITDYVFMGWNVTSPDGTSISEGKFTMPNEDVTITGAWKVDKNNNGTPDENEEFTIVYYDDDGTTKLHEETGKKVGNTLTVYTPEDTETDGRIFDKWTPAFNSTVTAEDDTDRDGIIAYTAVWKNDKNNNGTPDENETFTVIYYDEDGTTEYTRETDKEVGDVLTGFTPQDTNTDDKTFTGWNPTFKSEVAAEDADKYCLIKYTAIWKPDINNNGTPDDEDSKFTVTYTDGVDGEEVFADVSTEVLEGMPVPAFVPENPDPNHADKPAREGYVCTGWDPSPTGTVTANITYTAQWEIDADGDGIPDKNQEYVVSFDPVGKEWTNAPANQTLDWGSKVTKPADPEAEGFVFKAWYKEAECNTTWDFDVDVVKGVTVLYAKWAEDRNGNGTDDTEEPKYKITYTDGVEGEEVFKDKVFENVLVDLPTPSFGENPTRKCYVFKTWSPAVADKVTETKTYTAQWTEKKYTRIEDEEGNPITPKDPLPTDPEPKEGDRFLDENGDPWEIKDIGDTDSETGDTPITVKPVPKTYDDVKDEDGNPVTPKPPFNDDDNKPEDGKRFLDDKGDPYEITDIGETDPTTGDTPITVKPVPKTYDDVKDEDGNPVKPKEPIGKDGKEPKVGDRFEDENGDEYEITELGTCDPTTGKVPVTVGQVMTLTFDLDGGTLAGQTGTYYVKEVKNRSFVIPKSAPTKEGYVFDYWKGSKYYPGDTYVVKDNHKFTAIWKTADVGNPNNDGNNSSIISDTGSGTGNNSSSGSKNKSVKTGDENNVALWITLMLISCIGAIGSIAYRKRRD